VIKSPCNCRLCFFLRCTFYPLSDFFSNPLSVLHHRPLLCRHSHGRKTIRGLSSPAHSQQRRWFIGHRVSQLGNAGHGLSRRWPMVNVISNKSSLFLPASRREGLTGLPAALRTAPRGQSRPLVKPSSASGAGLAGESRTIIPRFIVA